MMNIDKAALGFNAVGSKHRLSVLLELVKVGKNGLTIGEIQERLDIPASTLAHHLDFLKNADLIYQERKGRSIFNYAKFDYIELLGNYLLKKCCVDQEKNKRKK